MRRIKPVLYALAASTLGAVCLACGSGGVTRGPGGQRPGAGQQRHGRRASGSTMCQPYQATDVAGGTYTVQDDEWDSKAAQCVSTKGEAAFTVTKSELANPATATRAATRPSTRAVTGAPARTAAWRRSRSSSATSAPAT